MIVLIAVSPVSTADVIDAFPNDLWVRDKPGCVIVPVIFPYTIFVPGDAVADVIVWSVFLISLTTYVALPPVTILIAVPSTCAPAAETLVLWVCVERVSVARDVIAFSEALTTDLL